MIDVEQMDRQIRDAMRCAGRGTWHFTLETESPYGDREENLKMFPPQLLLTLLFLESNLKKPIPNDFFYKLTFDECAPTLSLGYLDGWASFEFIQMVIKTTGQMSRLEDLRLNIGKLVRGVRTENTPPVPYVCNSAELFVYLMSLNWDMLRRDSLLAMEFLQNNSPAFKNAVKHGLIRSKDRITILVSGTKDND